MSPFNRTDADIVEIWRDTQLDLVAFVGTTGAVAYVSISNGPPVRLRRRWSRGWHCDDHGLTNPRCRHADDVRHAIAHLDREDRAAVHETETTPCPIVPA